MVMGEKVYVGGMLTSGSSEDDRQVFQYQCSADTWDSLPPCPAAFFAMAQFTDSLIAVGGILSSTDEVTAKVHTFTEATNQWEELLPPMPTARCILSVVTTHMVIIAAGGSISSDNVCTTSTVEVYSMASSQWHTADPLPSPCAFMASAIINNTCYLLGGTTEDKTAEGDTAMKDYFCASVSSMEHVDQVHQPTPHSESVWKSLPGTPLIGSTAVSLRGSLTTVGGKSDDNTRSTALRVLLDNTWVQLVNGDLPAPRSVCTAASLSSDEVIVIGGMDETRSYTNTVWIGRVVAQ